MQENTKHQRECTETTPGWIEDGNALKGDMIYDAVFDTFEEAFADLNKETLRLTSEIYDGLASAHAASGCCHRAVL
jgi:hypothetical protein